MAVNPDQLWSTLNKIEEKLLSIIDDFDAVSQTATALGGNLAKVLPVQLNASADIIINLVNGNEQNSIKNLKEYVDNIPLGDLRTKTAVETMKTPSNNADNFNSQINTTPMTNGVPKSAIARESINLDDYKKKPIKESKLNENNEFSFDAIKDETGIDFEGYNSDIPESDTSYLEDDLTNSFYDQFDTEDESDNFSFDDFETERLNDLNDDRDPTYEDAFEYNDLFTEDI